LGLAGHGLAAAAPAGFNDHFSTLDRTLWDTANGWFEGDWALCEWRSSQITTGPGGLVITLDANKDAKRGFISGQLGSRSLFQYGYFSASMMPPAGSGVDTSLFTYSLADKDNPSNEIDIEFLGKDTHAVQFTYHVGDKQYPKTIQLPFDFSESFHRYGFNWEANAITWYVDGKVAYRVDGSPLSLPSRPQHLFAEVLNSNSLKGWLGPFAWPGHPLKARYQCVSRSAGPDQPGAC